MTTLLGRVTYAMKLQLTAKTFKKKEEEGPRRLVEQSENPPRQLIHSWPANTAHVLLSPPTVKQGLVGWGHRGGRFGFNERKSAFSY